MADRALDNIRNILNMPGDRTNWADLYKTRAHAGASSASDADAAPTNATLAVAEELGRLANACETVASHLESIILAIRDGQVR
jgi:hypothetical protein